MRGASIVLTAGMTVLALVHAAHAEAASLEAVEKLARDKAIAVTLLKTRSERDVAIAAGDRLFTAYLNAATMGEAQRLRPRIEALLKALLNRRGIREVTVADLSGEFLARAGNIDTAVAKLDPKKDASFQTGLTTPAHRAVTLTQDFRLTLTAPIVVRENPEFVLSARQDFTSYRAVLAHSVPEDHFVVLADTKGRILADSRNAGQGTTAVVADLSLDQIRKAVPAGSGEIKGGENRFLISYRPVGEWTIIAAERIPAPRRCHAEGARLCG